MAPTYPVFTVDLTGELLGSGVHGLVEHDWARDGWAPFTPVVMTADEEQAFEQTVVDGAGVLTSTAPTGGSFRVAYLREGTVCRDSEVTSLVLGPGDWAFTNAQQGHLHRVREVAPGVWEAIAVWTAVFGGGYQLLNVRGVRFDGTTIWQSGGDDATAGDFGFIDHATRLTGVRRFTGFGLFLNEYQARDTGRLAHLLTGDLVTIADLTDTSFNETAVALNGSVGPSGVAQVLDPTHTDLVPWTPVAGGTLVPVSDEKRVCPFWLSTRVRGGTASALTVELKRWRPDEPEPDWSDVRVQRRAVVPDVDVPALAVDAGYAALWGAHFLDGSSGAWGGARFRRLSTA